MLRILPLFRQPRDGGIALPVAVGLGLVMTVLVATGLVAATSGLRQAVTDQNRTGAYDAAYAGVQDYLTRINADAGYARYGNSSSTFSGGSTVTALTSNPALGVGVDSSTNTWAAVPNGTAVPGPCTDRSLPCFRYEVDNRQLDAAGTVRLRSTGRVGDSTRTIVVTLKRQGFVNYLYYTNYETLDPALSGKSSCAVYAWEKPTRDSSCNIQFGAADILRGPVHSNDTIAACGATFQKLVTTANPDTPTYTTPAGCAAGNFQGGGPNRVSKIDMPETNEAMRAQTRSDLVSNTGCLYTGPTVVKFLGDGSMTVWSPWTKFTNITASTTTGSKPSKCGTPGTDAGQLGSVGGATVPELSLNLLYVQTVRTDSDPNAAGALQIPSGVTCVGPDGKTPVLDSTGSVGWKFGPWSFPVTDEGAPDGWDGGDAGKGLQGLGGAWNPSVWSTSAPAYGCRNGDLYIQGKVTTQTTAASDNYVYVTGDLTLDKASEDVLGLVGTNAVLVWNPVKANGSALNGGSNRTISAALLSVLHTVQVQNYNVGPARGVLTIFGSIAQKYRGTVATTSNGSIATGYSKDYQYDDLLKSVAPPYFLAPSTTTYLPRLYASVPSAYNADGSVRP